MTEYPVSLVGVTVASDTENTSSLLDDIFSDSPPSSPSHQSIGHVQDRSDVPRLREIHSKAGYRDGVSAGHEAEMQKGFVDTRELGIYLGMRVGHLIGILEGIDKYWGHFADPLEEQLKQLWKVVEERRQENVELLKQAKIEGNPSYKQLERKLQDELDDLVLRTKALERPILVELEPWRIKRNPVSKTLKRAREEMTLSEIFKSQFWDNNLHWRFKIGLEEAGEEFNFHDVTNAHPLIVKWKAEVERVMQYYGVETGNGIEAGAGFTGEEWEMGRVTD